MRQLWKKEAIRLSEHFTCRKLLRYTFPSIVMMIFSSVYSVVDGLFVSNFAGKTPFAAINFIMPYLMILSAGGFMLGAGGNAYIARLLGEGKNEEARSVFSLIVYTTVVGGLVLILLGQLCLRPAAVLLGAEGDMLENAVRYGRIVLCGGIPFMFQMEFQSLFSTAAKPKLGLIFTVAAGITNILLDALLIAVLRIGLVGAATATTISMSIGGLAPVIYFSIHRSEELYIGRTSFDGRALLQICGNGISEMVSNISMSLVSMLYNIQLLAIAGENGVAAYGVIMYVNMIFLSAFLGYSMGTAPVVGFHFGAKNTAELKSLLNKSLTLIGCFAVLMLLSALALSAPIAAIFAGYDSILYQMTVHGFRIYAISFLLAGLPIFGSSFFTALSNGKVSAVISFMRTLVFQTVTVICLPLVLGLNGVWMSIIVAEFLAGALALIFLKSQQKRYGY